MARAKRLALLAALLPLLAAADVRTVRGTVVRANSQEVRGAEVTLFLVSEKSEPQAIAVTKTGRNGRFTFTAASEKRYKLKVVWRELKAESHDFELTAATAPILLVLR